MGEFGGGELAAAAVEENCEGRGAGFGEWARVAGEPGEEGGFGGEGFGLDGVIRRDAVEIETGEGVIGGFGSGFGEFGADVG
jgi:hypothetical protein